MPNNLLEQADLYFGLTELQLKDSKIDLGNGILLHSAYAKFLSTPMLVNTDDITASLNKARPAYWQLKGGKPSEVTAELVIPANAAPSFDERFKLAKLIVFLIRLWTNPAIGLHVFSNYPLSSLTNLMDDVKPTIVPVEIHERYFHLGLVDNTKIVTSLTWIQENWKSALNLYKTSSEFRLAADALDSGQFIQNTALTLVLIWGALEAIFSASSGELKFRASSLIASYLEPPGVSRIEMQKHVAALYDKRSAAAHGKPRHENDDLVQTFELLRKVIIRLIHEGAVPSKSDLEQYLFGAIKKKVS